MINTVHERLIYCVGMVFVCTEKHDVKSCCVDAKEEFVVIYSFHSL